MSKYMKYNVYFDYKIDLFEIKKENQIDFSALSFQELYANLFDGRIYIFFNCKEKEIRKDFILLKTGIIDYILQFDGIIEEIDGGNNETFTVSADYYSNSLKYFYSDISDELTISEVNDNLFSITCNFSEFKLAYKNFRKLVLEELIYYYPKLKDHIEFINHFGYDTTLF